MIGRPKEKYTHLRDLLNEALTGKTRVLPNSRLGWVHRRFDSVSSISIDLGPTACASVKDLLTATDISFSMQTQPEADVADQFTRISISIPELSDAEHDGRLRKFLGTVEMRRDTLRAKQKADYMAVPPQEREPRNYHASKPVMVNRSDDRDRQSVEEKMLKSPSILSFVQSLGGTWHFRSGEAAYDPSIAEKKPTTIRGQLSSSKAAIAAANSLRNNGFEVEVKGTGTQSYIEMDYPRSQSLLNAIWAHRQGRVPLFKAVVPEEENEPQQEPTSTCPPQETLRRVYVRATQAPAMLPREDRQFLSALLTGTWKLDRTVQPTHDIGYDKDNPVKAVDDKTLDTMRRNQTFSTSLAHGEAAKCVDALRAYGIEPKVDAKGHLTHITLTTPDVTHLRQAAMERIATTITQRYTGASR